MNTRKDQFRLQACGQSDSGCLRESNEDAFYVSEQQGLFIVSDGMGGGQGGSLASALIVRTLPLQLSAEGLGRNLNQADLGPPAVTDTLIRAISVTNDLLLDSTRTHPEVAGLGATVVVGLYAGSGVFALAHLGDSRAYLLRAGYFQQLFTDHTMTEMLLQRGHITRRQARSHPGRHVLTCYIGKEDCPAAGTIRLSLEPGDRILLCTDGLTNMLNDRTIGTILLETEQRQTACQLLIGSANEAGGLDNVTVIIVDIGEPLPRQEHRPLVVRRTVGRPPVTTRRNPNLICGSPLRER